MKINEITAFRIKKLRNQKKLSQTDLAKLLEVSQTTITSWENNKQEPSLQKLSKLSKIFEVTPDYLLGQDLETIKGIKKLTSEEYIYDNSNYLTKEETTKLTNKLNEFNKVKNNNFKKEKLLDSDILQEIEYQDIILEIILSNEKLKFNLFDIDFKKPLYQLNQITTIEEQFCSYQQKHIIEELIQLNEEQTTKLWDSIYHIRKNTKEEEIFRKIIYMPQNLVNEIEAFIIGLEEKESDINRIKENNQKATQQ